MLPREAVGVPPLEVFTERLDGALSKLIKWVVLLPMIRELELDDL